MAVVGDAYIVVRALTNRVRPEIQKAFSGLDDIGRQAGEDISNAMNDAMNKNSGGGGGSAVGRALGGSFQKDAEKARIKLRQLTQTGFFAGPAFSVLASVLGSVGAGLVTLGVVAGAAAQGGLVILGQGLFAAAQAALTLKLALAGVGAALQAGLKASQGSAAQTKALENAEKRLEKAKLALFRVEQDRKDQIKDIRRANDDAQRAALDAAISSKRSDRAYQDSQRNTTKVIEQVTKAREDAIEALQQLRFETEGGAISEKKARIEFEKARDSLQRVQDLPPNSRARQEAELAFAEADLNLRMAIDRNKDLKDEEKKKTVEVAKLRATDVMKTQEVVDALKDEEDARVDAARAYTDALQAKQDAQQSALDLDSGKAFRDINRTLADANEAVKEAKKDLDDAKAGGGAADAFADAMAKLSPEAQAFVRYLISIQSEFKKLKAAAGKELFPRLETAIQNLVDNLFPKLIPLLEGTGKALGDAAIGISKVITRSDNLKLLEKIWKRNDILIGRFGKVIENLYTGFLNLLDAAWPLIDAFSQWVVEVTGAWSATMKLQNETGELDKKFIRIKEVLAPLGAAAGSFWRALKDIFSVIMQEGGAADDLVKYLKDAAAGFESFISKSKADGSLNTFFKGAVENFTKILDLIGNILGELFKLGDNQGTGQFVDSLNRAVDTFGRIADKLTGKDGAASGLGLFIEKFALLSEKLTDSGSIENFFKVLNGALDIANKIFGNEIVSNILKVTGLIIGLSKGFGLVFRTVSFVGKAIIGNFLNIAKFAKDPFAALRKGSGLTRAELKKQMVVDKQKQLAMQGVFVSGKQAARGIDLVKISSQNAKAVMAGTMTADAAKTASLKKLGIGARIAGVGVKGLGKAFAFIGGPIGIIFLILPLIMEHWDEIVAFFKDLIPKLGQIFSDMWGNLTKFLGEAWTNISTWFTQVFVPGLGDFFMKALEVIAFILFPLPSLIIKFWPQITAFFNDVIFPFFTSLPGKVVELAGKIWNFLSDAATTAWTAVSGWWTGTVVPWFTGLPAAIATIAGKVWEFFSNGVKIAWDFIVGYFTRVWTFYRELPGKVIGFAGKVWEFLSKGISNAWNAVSGFFTNTIFGFLRGLPAKITQFAGGMWDGLKSGLQGVIDFIRNGVNGIIKIINDAINGLNKINPFKKIPNIPTIPPIRLAKGGVVPATPGGTMALIGEAGRAERVEPLDANGLSKRDKAMIDYMSNGAGGGITLNVYPSAGMDEKELADLVSRKLAQQMRRGAA